MSTHGRHPRLQRQPTAQEEEIFRMQLMPLFEKHGNQGVPLEEFEEELKNTAIVQVIPQTKLDTLLQKADVDHDSYITYTEFMDLYNRSSSGLNKKEKSAMRKFVGAAINNIVPFSKLLREDFLENYNCRPPPLFMIAISVVEIAVFIYYAVLISQLGSSVTAFSGLLMINPLMYAPARRYEAWRYISYMLLHQGYVHLLANLLFQLMLGLPLEIVHKWPRVMLIYFCGVVGGSLAHSVTDYDVNLVGASGGCYAIIGAHFASVIVNWKEMNYKCSENPVRIVASAPFRLGILFFLVAADTGSAVFRRYYEVGAGKVGISAHIGGFLTGLLLGVPLMKNINKLAWESKVGLVTLCVYLVAVAFCIAFNGLYHGYPAADYSSCC